MARAEGDAHHLQRFGELHLDSVHARPLSAEEHQDGKTRSEEHTSELQSLAYLVCRLLLEKKNFQYQSPHMLFFICLSS